ncbi:MAG: hypothetical protein WD874_01370 [Parcubacteria group bacterium]
MPTEPVLYENEVRAKEVAEKEIESILNHLKCNNPNLHLVRTVDEMLNQVRIRVGRIAAEIDRAQPRFERGDLVYSRSGRGPRGTTGVNLCGHPSGVSACDGERFTVFGHCYLPMWSMSGRPLGGKSGVWHISLEEFGPKTFFIENHFDIF